MAESLNSGGLSTVFVCSPSSCNICFRICLKTPLILIKRNIILQHTMISWTMVCSRFLLQHDNAPVHKARSIKKWLSQFGVEELEWAPQRPALNPIQHLLDEFQCWPYRPASAANLANCVAPGWEQVPAAWLLPRSVRAVIAAYLCLWFWNKMFKRQCNIRLSIYFWPRGVP